MSITTKKGDKGWTSLFLGGRVAKDDPRVELIGTLDELCSFLGMSRSLLKNKDLKNRLGQIQKDLFVLGAEVSTRPPYLKRLEYRLGKKEIDGLEAFIGRLEAEGSCRKSGFCLPGEDFVASTLHICRTIARRAERQTACFLRKKQLKNRYLLIYLNRLSDLLFLMARCCEEGLRS